MLLQANVTRIKKKAYKGGGVFWDFAAGICLVEEAGGKAIFKKIDEDRYAVKFSNGLI